VTSGPDFSSSFPRRDKVVVAGLVILVAAFHGPSSDADGRDDQFSPLKERCLTYCRSPDSFILSDWRDGNLGAVIMGLRQGLFCMGCCAGLMLLLFAVAVMDLRWVAALAALVTAEKLLPRPGFWRIAIGVGLLAASCITWFWAGALSH
jgi:predicted metal-binding membrane protein